jgi:hypothetical protein
MNSSNFLVHEALSVCGLKILVYAALRTNGAMSSNFPPTTRNDGKETPAFLVQKDNYWRRTSTELTSSLHNQKRRHADTESREAWYSTQFSCFASTEVQILAQKALLECRHGCLPIFELLDLLALLVQTHKYWRRWRCQKANADVCLGCGGVGGSVTRKKKKEMDRRRTMMALRYYI